MDDPMMMLMLAAPVLSCFLSSSAGLVLWKMGYLCEWFKQDWACSYNSTSTTTNTTSTDTTSTDTTQTDPGSGGGGGGSDPGGNGNLNDIPPTGGGTDPTKPGGGGKPKPTTPGENKPNPSTPGTNVGSAKNIELGWWAWQNNSPCNSVATATNAKLYAFKSVSVPKNSGWKVGDVLYVKGLVGKVMPKSGVKHNGYVRVADYSDEATGWSTTNTNVPIVRIYLGDFKALSSSGYAACTRQSATKAGRNPPLTLGYSKVTATSWKLPISTTAQKKTSGNFNVGYGGNELGGGTCGVCYSGTAWNTTALGNCWFGGSTNKADCPKK